MLEPDVVEAAFDFLDQIKVPQSPSHTLTLASRNYSVHSNLAGYLSPESSLDKTLGQHVSPPDSSNDGLDVRLKEKLNVAPIHDSGEAKYYCSTDEPEPWDLIKLNLQASFICLSAKVSSLCSASHEAATAAAKLAPLAQMDGLSETSATSSDLLHNAALTPDDVSPTEDDSGICMERVTPEAERKQKASETKSPCKGGELLGDTSDVLCKPKLASIMETSREDTVDSEDTDNLQLLSTSDSVTSESMCKKDIPIATSKASNDSWNQTTCLDKTKLESELPSSQSVDDLDGIVPSIIKLRGAVDGAVRTARLVHSLHRLQLTTEAVHQDHALQYRRDVCFSQALSVACTALLSKLWSRSTDQIFLSLLQQLGPLLQFEGLYSCIGSDGSRMADMVIAIEDLATVQFVLVADCSKEGSSEAPEPAVTGNRCSMRVLLPVPQSVLSHMSRHSIEEPVSFHVTPVYFNIGVNENVSNHLLAS